MAQGFLVTLLFHKFGPPRYRGDPYSLSASWLRDVIQLSVESSCRFVDWDALAAGRFEVDERLVSLTFDDGFDSDITKVVPLLQEASVPATFFLVPSFVGQAGHLSWDQVGQLVDAGMCVGSHTMSHAWLPGLSTVEIEEELESSRQAIEQHIGAPVRSFSLPGGFYDRRVLNLAGRAGYALVGTTDYGVDPLDARPAQGPWILKRNSMDLRTSWDAVRGLLNGSVPLRLRIKSWRKYWLVRLIGPTKYRRLSSARRQG